MCRGATMPVDEELRILGLKMQAHTGLALKLHLVKSTKLTRICHSCFVIGVHLCHHTSGNADEIPIIDVREIGCMVSVLFSCLAAIYLPIDRLAYQQWLRYRYHLYSTLDPARKTVRDSDRAATDTRCVYTPVSVESCVKCPNTGQNATID